MKAITKKILLASVAVGVITPFIGGGGRIARAAEDYFDISSTSNNVLTINNNTYTLNGTTTSYGNYLQQAMGYFWLTMGANESNENVFTLDGGKIRAFHFAVAFRANSATKNILNLNNGTLEYSSHPPQIYVAYCLDDGDATLNELNIKEGMEFIFDYNSSIYCGLTSSGNATQNKINIYGGTINANIHGGSVTSGNASQNEVNIYGGTISGGIVGGSASPISGGTADNNIVRIYNNPVLTNASLWGGYYGSTGSTGSGNTLEIYTKGLTAKNISDFQIINFYLPESTVNGDTILTLTSAGTDISNAQVNAGVQGNANLNNGDVVTLLTNGGTITDTGTTYGKLTEGVSLTYDLTVKKDGANKIIATIGSTGDSDSGSSDSGSSDSGGSDSGGSDSSGSDSGGSDSGTPTVTDDSNNVKNFYNTDSGNLYGGYTDSGNAQNNTVNLYSGNFENIYGGYAPNGSTSNNVLNVRNKNISAQNLYNFSAMNFYIPNDAANGDTMLKLTDSAATDLSGVSIRAGVVAGNGNLAVGDTINLLQNSNGFKTDSATNYGRLTEGVSLDYGLTVSNGGSNILATINSVPQNLNSQTQSIPLGTGLTSIKTVDAILDNNTLPDIGLDFDFESDTEDASAAEISDVVITEPKGWEIFASAGGGALKTKAGGGAYVDMKFSSFDVGLARTLENGGAGKLVFAPIIDYAHGNYDSYLADGTHGSGSTKYIAGGGVFRNMWNNGFYVEGSYRIGRVRNNFASNDMDKTFGQRVSYDTKATAMAGHLKLGRNLRLNKNNLLDVYATYYHAHQGGMDATLAPYGDQYRISSANSGRFRLGYRMTTRTSKISRIYTGLAYQYEHASGITANYLSKNLSTASAGDKGSSGMIELGWQIKPLKNNPWMVDINATGWVGHQRGVTATAKIQKAF